MRASQKSPFLDRLTYDVRLSIYAYIVLPPFSGCRDYRGLSLSCRQVCNEVDQEGTRQLRFFLHDISRTGIVKFAGDVSLQSNAQSSVYVDHCLRLQFGKPASVLRPVVVFVRVPFTLPPAEHDWHLQPPLRTLRMDREGNSHHIIHRPRTEMPRGEMRGSQDATQSHKGHIYPRQHATQQSQPQVWHLPITIRHHSDSRIIQQRQYAIHVKELLKPIDALQGLHADIQIQLTADEGTIARILQELVLHSNFDLETSYKFDSTALGWLLEMYVNDLKQRCLHNIGARRRNWAFNTRAMDIVWDMTSSDPVWSSPQLPQSHWTPRTVPNTRFGSQGCHESQLLCTDDCREGMVRLKFDAKKDIQARLVQAEKNLRDMVPERHQTAEAYIERLEYDIFHNKEKLSVLSVAGYKQSGSQEEREKMLDESWRKRREATKGSTIDGC